MRACDRLLPRLESVRARGSDRWSAKCPAHIDKTPSLSVRQTEDRCLVKCWSGCTARDITAAVGLSLQDLFNESQNKPDPKVERRCRIQQGFRQWRSTEILKTSLELRRRDQFVVAITAAADLGLLTEDEAINWLAEFDPYNGYSELEHRFQTLLTGTTADAFEVYCETRR